MRRSGGLRGAGWDPMEDLDDWWLVTGTFGVLRWREDCLRWKDFGG